MPSPLQPHELPDRDGTPSCSAPARDLRDLVDGLHVRVLHHYVIVRRDLPRGLGVAQVIHAAGESALLAEALPPGTHAVALFADDEATLVGLGRALRAADIPHVAVYEDDPPYTGQLMALGVAPVQRTPQLKRLLGRYPTIK